MLHTAVVCIPSTEARVRADVARFLLGVCCCTFLFLAETLGFGSSRRRGIKVCRQVLPAANYIPAVSVEGSNLGRLRLGWDQGAQRGGSVHRCTTRANGSPDARWGHPIPRGARARLIPTSRDALTNTIPSPPLPRLANKGKRDDQHPILVSHADPLIKKRQAPRALKRRCAYRRWLFVGVVELIGEELATADECKA